MLTFTELERAVEALGLARSGARLEKTSMPSADELVLELAGGGDRRAGDKALVLLSCRPGFARLSELGAKRPALPKPPAFGQYLRAHLQGGRLVDVRLRGGDRQASLHFDTREGRLELLLSVLGPRSNLYLLDDAARLLVAARPLADTRRDLAVGAPWCDPDGRPPRIGEDRFADTATPELLTAIEQHYGQAESGEAGDRLQRRLDRALGKARAAIEKKLRRLEEDAQAGSEAPRFERLGELLKTRLGDVRPGATEIEATDFETGESVTIPLDPKKSASKNMDELFRRARKAERKAQKAAMDVGAHQARLEEHDALAAELAGADSPEAREAFAERPQVARLLDRFAPERAETTSAGPTKKVWKLGKRELPGRLVPKRYRTRDGLEVWVGKSDEGNDILTTRLSRGRDLFFHLEGDPGSHVVLRVENDEPPQESLLDAAELAVNFSKAKNATRASVHIARIKDISKPSGAKPGLVYVHRGRTIQLRRSQERLDRVLAARIEE